jgi:hypothetical protein
MNYMKGIGGVYRLPEFSFIPQDPENRDWVAYLAWLAEGNVPLDNDMPLPANGKPHPEPQ